MTIDDRRARSWNLLSWIMYALAAMLAVASILLGLSVSGASAAIPAATIGFQAPIFKPVWDALVSALQFLGVLVLGGGLVLAILLLSIGLLVGRIAALERRVSQLEGTAALATAQPADYAHQTAFTPSVQPKHTR